MFKGRSLTDLAKELERQANAKADFRAPSSLMEMSLVTPKGTDLLQNEPRPLQFRVGDKFTGAVTEHMHDQLMTWADIPAKYYDRMRNGVNSDRALFAANLNHWLRNAKETRLVRTLDSRARAFLSNRYRMIDHWDIANATLPVLLNESQKLGALEVVSTEVTEKRLYIKVASQRLTYEVKKGDVVQLGINVSNSEIGAGSVRVEPFLKRLICDNGAVIEDAGVRKFHLGRQTAELEAAEQVFRDETRKADDRAFVMKLQDVLRAAFDDENFARLKGMTIDATTRKITAPIPEVVEEVANRYHLSEKHQASFLHNLIEGGDTTQWGLANAVTAIANTADDYETATTLEKIGGDLMTMDAKRWQELAATAA